MPSRRRSDLIEHATAIYLRAERRLSEMIASSRRQRAAIGRQTDITALSKSPVIRGATSPSPKPALTRTSATATHKAAALSRSPGCRNRMPHGPTSRSKNAAHCNRIGAFALEL